MLVRPALLALLITTLTAATAHADGYVSPSLGVAFGNASAQGRANFVFDVGWLPREPIGLELDTTFAPSFFGNQGPYGSNGVTTVMGNVVVAAGESSRYARYRSNVRPFISGGLGLIRETTTSPLVSNDDLGVNLGVGVMAVPRHQIGVRGELRYFRSIVGTASGNTTGIDFGSFHFWRAGIGLLITF